MTIVELTFLAKPFCGIGMEWVGRLEACESLTMEFAAVVAEVQAVAEDVACDGNDEEEEEEEEEEEDE